MFCGKCSSQQRKKERKREHNKIRKRGLSYLKEELTNYLKKKRKEEEDKVKLEEEVKVYQVNRESHSEVRVSCDITLLVIITTIKSSPR